MDEPRRQKLPSGDENWRSALAERTRVQEVTRRRYGNWVVGGAIVLGTVVLAGVFGPSDNRAALHQLWSDSPTPHPTEGQADPEESMRRLLEATKAPPPPTDSSATSAKPKNRPAIDHGDIEFAAELIDFMSPHGNGAKQDGKK